ncbi:MAG: GNAT family N-acetyltransferase [Bacteroidia bacterium]
MYKLLDTERLHIRPLEIGDSNFMLQLLNTPGWLQFVSATAKKCAQPLEAENYIRKTRANNPLYFCSVFELKETRQPIGVISFLHRANHQFPDIGYAMLPAFEKNGFAFEACSSYLNEIKNEKIAPKGNCHHLAFQ